MKIVLYYAPNTCALAPYITLTEARADFEVRPLNYRKRENEPTGEDRDGVDVLRRPAEPGPQSPPDPDVRLNRLP